MTKDAMIADFYKRYEELKSALKSADIDRIREISLDVHAMVHPAEVSGRADKTIADYTLESMLSGGQNKIVPGETCITLAQSRFHCAGSYGTHIVLKTW